MGEMHENPGTSSSLEEWMKSYRPEELFDEDGRLRPELAELAPKGDAAHERQPARQRRRCSCGTCACPTSATTPSRCPRPARPTPRPPACMGKFLRDVMKLNLEARNFRALQPGREQLEPLAGRARGHRPRLGRARSCPTTTTSRPTAA